MGKLREVLRSELCCQTLFEQSILTTDFNRFAELLKKAASKYKMRDSTLEQVNAFLVTGHSANLEETSSNSCNNDPTGLAGSSLFFKDFSPFWTQATTKV